MQARSANPFETPDIQPNYLAGESDQQVLLAGMRLGRRLMHTTALAPYFECETAPGDDLQADDELLDFARQNGTTVYHLIGIQAWGPLQTLMRLLMPNCTYMGSTACALLMRLLCRPCRLRIPTLQR